MARGRSGPSAPAGFAALTAIFAKIGVEHVSPDIATLIRTVVVLVALAALVGATRQFPDIGEDFRAQLCCSWCLAGLRHGSLVVVLLPRAAASGMRRAWHRWISSACTGGAVRVSFLGEKLAPVNWSRIGAIAAGARFVTLKAQICRARLSPAAHAVLKETAPAGRGASSLVTPDGCHHRDWPVRSIDRPRRPAPVLREAALLIRHALPALYARRPPPDCDPGKAALSARIAWPALAPGLGREAPVLREAALLIRYCLATHARNLPLTLCVHRGKAPVGGAPFINSS